jgi:hypothetical protein
MGEDFGGEFCMPIISVESMEPKAADDSYLNRVIFNSDNYYGIPRKKNEDDLFFLEAEIEDENEVLDLLFPFLFGKRYERTLNRLNNEWLLKIWKVSDDNLLVFRTEQMCKRFDRAQKAQSLMQDRWEQIRKTILVKDLA